jgi:surface antigen
VETLTSSELQAYISIDRGEGHIMQHTKDKLSHWLLSSVAFTAILVPLLLVETGSIVKAQGFKSKQLIAQSCRNIEIRPQPRRNIILPKGTLRVTCGYKLQFQGDGNLVLLNKSGKVLWATGTEGRGERLVMQADGNLVIYDSGNKPLWATNTSGNPGSFFAIQGDGNLVIYKANGTPLWGSGTERGQARTTNAGGEWQAASNPQPKPTEQPSPPPNTRSSKRKIDTFVNQFNGTRNIQRYDHLGDPDYQGQCVTLVIRYLQDHYGASRSGMALGHGKDVATGAGNQLSGSFLPISDPSDPIPGSIISFQKGDPYGHVALVVNSRRDGNLLRITILESNGDNQALAGNSLVRLKDITVNASPPYGTNYVGNASWVNPRD